MFAERGKHLNHLLKSVFTAVQVGSGLLKFPIEALYGFSLGFLAAPDPNP
jgi:hypothetical protein